MNQVNNNDRQDHSSFDYAWILFVALAALAITGLYFSNFSLSLSDDPAKWGDFGDYFGGVLGPIVAFAAFYYLWVSIGIQRTELAATTRALQENVVQQTEIARLNNVNIALRSHAAQLDYFNAEIKVVNEQIYLAQDRIAKKAGESVVYDDQGKKIAAQHYAEMKFQQLSALKEKRRSVMQNMNALLKQSN